LNCQVFLDSCRGIEFTYFQFLSPSPPFRYFAMSRSNSEMYASSCLTLNFS
jgi:hypothetical protein